MYFVMSNRLPVTEENGELKFFDTLDAARVYCEKELNFWEICKIMESE